MRKICLLCAGGMSTSILAKNMRKVAEEQGYDVEVTAYSVALASQVAEEADIILLGPQIRHKLSKVKEEVTCPIEVIEMRAYGMMDGEAIIRRVKEVLGD